MFERFDRDVRLIVMLGAIKEAERRRDPRIGTEHLLIATADAPIGYGAGFFTDIGASATEVRRTLDEFDDESLARIGVVADLETLHGGDELPPARRRRLDHRPLTSGAKAALHRTLQEAVDLGQRRIGAEHLVLGLTSGPPQDLATILLRRLGLDPDAVHATVRSQLRASA